MRGIVVVGLVGRLTAAMYSRLVTRLVDRLIS